MKLLYINYLPVKDGSNIHVNSFAKAVDSLGHDIDCLWHYAHHDRKEITGNGGINKLSLLSRIKRRFSEMKSIILNIKYLLKDYKYIKMRRSDALIVRYTLNAFSAIFLAKIFKIPLILEVNSPLYYERTKMGGRTEFTKLSQRIEMWILDNATKVCTVSDELREYFVRQGIQSDHIESIHNGVDTELFFPRKKDEILLNKLGIALDEFIIGFSGSFMKWHGILDAVEIVKRLSELYEDRKILLLLIGDGPMRDELETRVASDGLKNVIFCGKISHEKMPSYLSLFDVALAPYPEISFFYFSPLKIFEYMAMGIPTIASSQGQILKLISNKKTGILIQPGDVNGYVKAISEIIKNPEEGKRIGTYAAQIARDHLGWESTAAKYSELAKSMIR